MKVSVITSCYNRAATIRNAIESVLAQDYPDIEYIVVDGASTDGSLDIIKEYSDKISILISEPDHGMYEALNKGMRAATGDIIGLVHSDDCLYDNSTISDMVRAFEKSQADFIYGDGIYVDANNDDKIIRNWIGGNYHRWKIKTGWLPLHPTCYLKRNILSQVGYYNEEYKIAADTDFLIRCLYEIPLRIFYLKRYIIRMKMGGLSTDKKKRKAMWKEDISVYKRHGFAPIPSKLMKMAWKVPQFIFKKKAHGSCCL